MPLCCPLLACIDRTCHRATRIDLLDRWLCRAAATVTVEPIAEDVKPLFQPFKLGSFDLKHRIVYAPLTRCRATDTVPIKEAALYYSQRATEGGLMISEGTITSVQGHG